jgi:hypothetical protein
VTVIIKLTRTKDWFELALDEIKNNLKLLNQLGTSKSEFFFNQDMFAVDCSHVHFGLRQFKRVQVEEVLNGGILRQLSILGVSLLMSVLVFFRVNQLPLQC